MENKFSLDIKSKDDLLNLINNEIEESYNLEYKAADAIKLSNEGKKEIVKDISGMANANGGIIIYGIKEFKDREKKHLPEKIDPLSYSFSKEQLEQIIDSNTSPRIKNIKIESIPIEDNKHVLIVYVSQSQTAIQNTKDKIYYKRFNFKVEAMYDYEIRDIMNRNMYPDIDLKFQIIKYLRDIDGKNEIEIKNAIEYKLIIEMINNGSQFANYVNYTLEINSRIIYNQTNYGEYYGKVYTGKNLFKTNPQTGNYIVLGTGHRDNYAFDPILPKTSKECDSIRLFNKVEDHLHEIIKYQIFADNAPTKYKEINLSEIEIIVKDYRRKK